MVGHKFQFLFGEQVLEEDCIVQVSSHTLAKVQRELDKVQVRQVVDHMGQVWEVDDKVQVDHRMVQVDHKMVQVDHKKVQVDHKKV